MGVTEGSGRSGGRVAAGSEAEAVERARAAFAAGRTRPLAWRKEQLRGIEALVRREEDVLLGAMAEDLGKPRVEAWLTDLAPVVGEARDARRNLWRWTLPRPAWPGPANLPGTAFTVAEPLGTVLVIAPWNYPVQLALGPLVGVLAAGNAAVLKPSELTPATSQALASLLPRYVDPEAVGVVEGDAAVAQELLRCPFEHVFFTGSTSVGRLVMEAAARQLASVTLELGGKSPVIVAGDADVPLAARRIAWAKLVNAGQTCVAPDYVLAERSVADALVDALLPAIDELTGSGRDAASKSGGGAPEAGTRIVSARHVDRLAGLVEGCGGEVVRGGMPDRDQRLFPPTVVREPKPDSRLMEEEIFGPILPVLAVESVAEAIEFVRRRPKPLALYLFTGSRRLEREVVGATSSGAVVVNHLMTHVVAPGLPFGGVGPSGQGAYHGRAGFEELSHRKPVVRRRLRPDLRFAYPPFDAAKERILRRLL